MYAKGMAASDIESHIRDIYGIEGSDMTVSRVTDQKILPIAKKWLQRPPEAVYTVIFLDAIIVKKAVCFDDRMPDWAIAP